MPEEGALLANLANVVGAFAAVVAEVETNATTSAFSESDRTSLLLVAKYPNCTINQLRKPLRLSHSGCVRLVDRLVKHGLLVRQTGVEDARSVRLKLTEAGEFAAASGFAQRRSGLVPIAERQLLLPVSDNYFSPCASASIALNSSLNPVPALAPDLVISACLKR